MRTPGPKNQEDSAGSPFRRAPSKAWTPPRPAPARPRTAQRRRSVVRRIRPPRQSQGDQRRRRGHQGEGQPETGERDQRDDGQDHPGGEGGVGSFPRTGRSGLCRFPALAQRPLDRSEDYHEGGQQAVDQPDDRPRPPNRRQGLLQHPQLVEASLYHLVDVVFHKEEAVDGVAVVRRDGPVVPNHELSVPLPGARVLQHLTGLHPEAHHVDPLYVGARRDPHCSLLRDVLEADARLAGSP